MLKNKLNYLKKLISPMGVAYTSLFLTFPALALLSSYSSPSPSYRERPQYNTELMVQVRKFLAQNHLDNTPSNKGVVMNPPSPENE